MSKFLKTFKGTRILLDSIVSYRRDADNPHLMIINRKWGLEPLTLGASEAEIDILLAKLDEYFGIAIVAGEII